MEIGYKELKEMANDIIDQYTIAKIFNNHKLTCFVYDNTVNDKDAVSIAPKYDDRTIIAFVLRRFTVKLYKKLVDIDKQRRDAIEEMANIFNENEYLEFVSVSNSFDNEMDILIIPKRNDIIQNKKWLYII